MESMTGRRRRCGGFGLLELLVYIVMQAIIAAIITNASFEIVGNILPPAMPLRAVDAQVDHHPMDPMALDGKGRFQALDLDEDILFRGSLSFAANSVTCTPEPRGRRGENPPTSITIPNSSPAEIGLGIASVLGASLDEFFGIGAIVTFSDGTTVEGSLNVIRVDSRVLVFFRENTNQPQLRVGIELVP